MILNRNKHILRSKQNWVGKCHPRGFIVQVTGLVDHHLSLTLATVQVVCIHHVSTPGLTAHYKEVEVRHLSPVLISVILRLAASTLGARHGSLEFNDPKNLFVFDYVIVEGYNQDFEAVYYIQKVGLWGIDGSYEFFWSLI